jgi:hypothetical protein
MTPDVGRNGDNWPTIRGVVKGGRVGVTLAAVGLVAAFATVASAGSDAGLLRPLHLPHIAPGTRCPVSQVDRRIQFSGRFGVALGIGRGPAYPIGLPSGNLRLAPAKNFGSRSWAGQKVLWLVLPAYRGPVLIRGARIDGRGLVRFQSGNVPPKQLRIPVGETQGSPGIAVPKGTRYLPSATRVREPGCYAYQIDGTTFSRVVVFHANW